jgi:hypothetical protein
MSGRPMAMFRYESETNAALARTLSESRFSFYLAAVGGLDVQGALDLYVWNIRLGAAFYGALAIFEITLRNALHRTLSGVYGSRWFNDPRFVAMAQAVLHPPPRPTRLPRPDVMPDATDLLRDIAKVEDRLRRQLANRSGARLPSGTKLAPSSNDIVAALDFGYWTNLFNRDLDAPLFVTTLYKAFPFFRDRTGARKNPARSDLARELNAIRKFRNRIMHFEPLFKGNVVDELDRIVLVCSWIDYDAANWILHHSALDELFRDCDRPRVKF